MTNTELQEKIAHLEAELAEVKEMAEAMKKRADGVFKPEYGEEYWFVSSLGDILDIDWVDSEIDEDRYAIGNCFPTEQEAEDAIRVLKLTQKAKESQRGFVPDWENWEQNKYALYFEMGDIHIMQYTSRNIAPIFGFWEDESVCEQFIDENREDLIWFFTEYRR